jgi:hypothetical protein
MVSLPYQRRPQLPATYQFAQIESALATMHKVASDRRSAFQGRLKHYQKQGFPEGINTGRGRAAAYTAIHGMHLAIALEFNELGILPERAINMYKAQKLFINNAIARAAHDKLCDEAHELFVYFDPSALNDLRGERSWDDASISLGFCRLDWIQEVMEEPHSPYRRRIAFVNLTTALVSLCQNLGNAQSDDWRDILSSIRNELWAENSVHP